MARERSFLPAFLRKRLRLRGRRAKEIHDFGASEQNKVMARYRRLGAVRNRLDEGALHMFFSPWKVPKGLTSAQVRECISKIGLRDWQRAYAFERIESKGKRLKPMHLLTLQVTVAANPPLLPEELSPTRRMTARRFRVGMRKFNEEVIRMLLRDTVR